MATPAQIRANQQNAQKSTGPRTRNGKAVCSQNAIKHSLTAKRILVTGEDSELFNAILRQLTDAHQPADAQEKLLVIQIAEQYWRLCRARNSETMTYNRGRQQFFNHPGRAEQDRTDFQEQLSAAYSFDVFHEKFAKLQRYEAAIERSYFRLLDRLENRQAKRMQRDNRIGSVSQNHVGEPGQAMMERLSAASVRAASAIVSIDGAREVGEQLTGPVRAGSSE